MDGVENWTQSVTVALGSDVSNSSWVSDRALFEFFWQMGRSPEAERLSHGAGKGLW